MLNPQHKKIYEFIGSRNLYTSPLDVTGLDGDKWDYMVEFVTDTTGVDSNLQIRCNSDSGTNYRDYFMQGVGASASASIDDSNTEVQINTALGTSSSGVTKVFITGDSSGERYFNCFSASDSKVFKSSHYWKNSVDNLISLEISGGASTTSNITLRIYQVPKQANLNNYDLIDVVEFSSRDLNTNPIVFSGLDGDSDGEYLLMVKDLELTIGSQINTQINGDQVATNYVNQTLVNNAGTIQAQNPSTIKGVWNSGDIFRTGGLGNFSNTIYAKSGSKRLVQSTGGKTLVVRQGEVGCWWNNTVDNITQISIWSDTVGDTATGTVKLYRRKSNKTIDPVPMTTVVEHDISGVDFSAGITISNIEGDRINGAIKVEYIGEGSTQLRAQVNGDTASNYVSQRLVGITSSAVAASSTIQYLYLCEDGSTTNTSSLWLYTNSGQNRPALSRYCAQENRVDFRGQWWDNSVNEITSIKIYASSTNAITGKLRISIPENTKQASPSWTVS